MRAFGRWTAAAVALSLLLAGCMRQPPETGPGSNPAVPPSDPCHGIEERLALQVPDPGDPSSAAEAEAVLQRLAALADDPVLRRCLALRMATSPTGPGR